MRINIEKSKSGHYGAIVHYIDALTQNNRQIHMCSKYDPIKEAEEWAKKNYVENIDTYIVYGIGMGYHLSALKERLHSEQKIYVIETNKEMANIAYEYNSQFNKDIQKIKVILTDNFEEVCICLDQLLNAPDEKYGKKELIFHQPSINIIPYELIKLRELLEVCLVRTQNNGIKESQTEQIAYNYKYNEKGKYPNVEELFCLHRGKKFIIVSAGPSLEKNIDYLRDTTEDIIILATGRILRTLIDRDIIPDFFCMIDATEGTLEQIKGVENLSIPLIFLNTTYYKTVEKYQGPKYIAYSMDSPEEQKGKIASGGSVATAAIDIAINMGASKIILVGQDLAYTNYATHMKDARAENIVETPITKKVKDIYGKFIPTSLGLLSMKYWIEQKIKKHPEIEFINCTEGGAYIEGCKHVMLKEELR